MAKPRESAPPATVVVLAAGEGTRMKSDRPKVLHPVAGRSMLGHVLEAVSAAGLARTALVVGPGRDDVAAEARRFVPDASIHVQAERLGTANAVLAARPVLAARADDLVVAFADNPLVRPETFRRMRQALSGDVAIAVLGFEAADPTGYGRLIMEGDRLAAIREEKDASPAERHVTLSNAGLMALAGRHGLAILDRVGNANAKGEYYLTDAVEIARSMGLAATSLVVDEEEMMGVNDRVQLAEAEDAMQKRLRQAAQQGGATLIAPQTVFFSADTKVGRDVTIEPHVVLGPGVVLEDGCTIKSFSHLEGARVRGGAVIGPFARLRPGADIGRKARVGNFVEVKNATLGDGAKANHLAYLGDATIGAASNIGAGTITCNYDGFRKHKTTIGEGAFIGSNSSLVAPVKIGAGAYVATGAVVTRDVPGNALAVARARQENKDGWAEKFRDKFGAAKDGESG